MKKFVSLILIIMLLTCSMAFAEPIDYSAYSLSELQVMYGDVLAEIVRRTVGVNPDDMIIGEKEITFRNVPWGSNPATYLEMLADANIKGNVKAATGKLETWEYYLDYGKMYRSDNLKDSGYSISSKPENLVVAGYPVKAIDAYFLNTYDTDTVYTEQEKAGLYRADYSFDVVDNSAAYEMLKAKLSALYGECTEENSTGKFFASGGYYNQYFYTAIWYGANDTAITLWRIYETLESDGSCRNSSELYLSYGKSNSRIIMNELKAAQAREELKKVADSTDGL